MQKVNESRGSIGFLFEFRKEYEWASLSFHVSTVVYNFEANLKCSVPRIVDIVHEEFVGDCVCVSMKSFLDEPFVERKVIAEPIR